MELHVWVDGITRVISGATEDTTCEQVVRALAQATGRTGRFTLVERWRNNERMLSPSDRPLHLLQQWGEYASDVHLILRHSGLTDKSHNVAHSLPSSRSSSLKKSLTFNGPRDVNAFPRKLVNLDTSEPITGSLDRYGRRREHSQSERREVKSPGDLLWQRGEADGQKLQAEREELINLVNLQLDKLQTQEQSMNDLQVQIVEVESRLPDSEIPDNEDQAQQLTKQLHQLHQMDQQLGTELRELELVSWEDKLKMENELHEQLSRQINNINDQVKRCQNKLDHAGGRIRTLSGEIENSNSELQQQVTQLQKELEATFGIGKMNSSSLTTLEMEIKDMEINIMKKKAEIEDLERELRDMNLNVFPELNRTNPQRRSAQELSQHPLSVRAVTTPPRSVIFNAQTLKEAVTGESAENIFV